MPRPGDAPIRAGADAPHGESADLARMQTVVPEGAQVQPPPQRPGPGRPRQPPPPLPEEDPNADLNDGYDEALFGPTMRPSEPLTAGASFGPGANFIPRPDEDDRSFTLRVADTLEASGSARLKPYIDKLRFGG